MSYAEYVRYKLTGKKCFKAPWVYDWWDCIKLDKEQYKIFTKLQVMLIIVITIVMFSYGFVIGYFLL